MWGNLPFGKIILRFSVMDSGILPITIGEKNVTYHELSRSKALKDEITDTSEMLLNNTHLIYS